MALLEAKAAGAAIVATRVNEIPEILGETDGRGTRRPAGWCRPRIPRRWPRRSSRWRRTRRRGARWARGPPRDAGRAAQPARRPSPPTRASTTRSAASVAGSEVAARPGVVTVTSTAASGRTATMSAICGIVGEARRAAGAGATCRSCWSCSSRAARTAHRPRAGRRRPAGGVRRARSWPWAGCRAQPVVARGADPATLRRLRRRDLQRRRGARASCAAPGRTLRGDDDGELFAHLYELEGPAGFRRVDGQFALALWDGRRQTLVLARDSAGRARALLPRHAGGRASSPRRSRRCWPCPTCRSRSTRSRSRTT